MKKAPDVTASAPSLDRRLEEHARDAVRALIDDTVRVHGEGTVLITPTMAKDAIVKRLRDVLGPGVLPPRVEVRMNAARTGFDIDMRKGIALVADGGSAEVAGSNAITAYGRRFPVDPTAYSVSFNDAGFIRNYRITLDHGQFASYGEVAELFTGIFAIVLERTFKVKFEARQFSAENITSSLPVKDENRVFVVPKSSRTFAASSTGGDI